jgi:hypothetical protein
MRAFRTLCILAVTSLGLVLTPVAGAARPATWTGTTYVASIHGRHLPWGMHGRRSFHVPSPRARAAIVGGSSISIEQAPWQATVFAAVPVEENGKVVGFVIYSCGGSILDATHILTVAACVYDPTTLAPLPAADIAVVTGVSNLSSTTEPNEQFRETSSLRVHPYFNYSAGPGTPDDVAVVTLSEALTLSSAAGTAVNLIDLAGPSATPSVGADLNFTGFGRETPGGEANGSLNSLSMTLGFSRRCGGEADAVFLCANASTGSACTGDAGSGLTTPGASPTLVGIMDTIEIVSGSHCTDGATAGFVNVTAPEIRDFIDGSETPPEAPRGGSGIEIAGVPVVGHSLTCSPGSWSGGPTFTYIFINSSGEQVLQSSSSPAYQLTTADVGRTILCELQATNAGGTAAVKTGALRPIEAGASTSKAQEELKAIAIAHEREEMERKAREAAESKPPNIATLQGSAEGAAATSPGEISLPSTSVPVQSNQALVKLDCTGSEDCHGKLTLIAKSTIKAKGKKKIKTVTIGAESFSISGDRTTTVKIDLDATGRALLTTGHGRLTAHLAILELEPGPKQTRSESVQLIQQKTHSKKR